MRTPVAPLFVPGHMERLRDKVVELDVEGLRIDLEIALAGVNTVEEAGFNG